MSAKCVCTCGCANETTGGVSDITEPDAAPEPICESCWGEEGIDTGCGGLSPGEAAAIEEFERRRAEGTLRTVPLGVTENGYMIETTGSLADFFDQLDREGQS